MEKTWNVKASYMKKIGKKFIDLGGSFNMYVVSNNDGKISVDILSK